YLAHRVAVKHTGNVMGDCRCYFATAGSRELGEKGGSDLAANIGEGVAIEKKKRRPAMTLTQEIYGFFEGEDLLSFGVPLCCARRLSFSIKAVLRASSCARSSIEADDKLPVPVFDKSGSGL